jgi:hypothetical protein
MANVLLAFVAEARLARAALRLGRIAAFAIAAFE